uniref:Putative secreted protein n=1 Tax=Ixodes ricinus TaxID=34613 RepID=A0A6B0UFG9_IXORI
MDMARFMFSILAATAWPHTHQRPRRKQVLKLSITDGSVLVEEDDTQSSCLSPHGQSLPYAQFGIDKNLPTRPTFKTRKGTTTDSSAHLQKQGLGMHIAQYQT